MVLPSGFGGNGAMVLAIGWTQVLIAVILVSLRLYGASTKAGQLRWDFLYVSIATTIGIISHAAATVSVYYGMGNSVANLTFPQIFAALQWFWINIFIGLVAVIFAKFAIIALLISLLPPNAKKRRIFFYTLGAVIAVAGIVQIPLSLFQCEPFQFLWDRRIVGAKCPRTKIAGDWSYTQGGIAVVSDIILALYPISIAWNLQTTRRVKIAFCALMAIGVLPSITSIVRVVDLHKLVMPKDATDTYARWMLWATSELWLVIILGSIPPLRPLFIRWGDKVVTIVSTNRTGTVMSMGKGSRAGTSRSGNITTGSIPLGSINDKQRSINKSAIGKPMLRSHVEEDEKHLVRTPTTPQSRGIMVQHEFAVEKGERRPSGGSRSWFDGASAEGSQV